MTVCTMLILALTLLLWGVPREAQAIIYYLNPAGGLDANPGTSPTSAWKTLGRAIGKKGNPHLNAGDTLQVLAGTYTASQYWDPGVGYDIWNTSDSAGSPGSPIIIEAAQGATVLFDGQWNSWWMPIRSHHIVIRGLRFTQFSGGGCCEASASVLPPDPPTGTHIGFVNNYQDKVGSSHSAPINSTGGRFIIWQGNTVKDVGSPSYPGNGDFSNIQGTFGGQHAMYISNATNDMVFDGNYVELVTGFGFHGYVNPGCTSGETRSRQIVRRNQFINIGWISMTIHGCGNADHFYFYNNTAWNDGNPVYGIVETGTGLTFVDESALRITGATITGPVFVKNNLFAGYFRYNNMRFAGMGSQLTSDYNLNQNTNGSGELYNWEGSGQSLAQMQARGFEANGKAGVNPLYTSTSGRDFTPAAGSPAIDAGGPLTTATSGSGGSSTTLQVAEAGYFHDSYELRPAIQGDIIQIGPPQALGGQPPVEIQSINYATNTMTLVSARTWSSGAAVGLAYNGSAPDMGAIETGITVVTPYNAAWAFEQASGGTVTDTTGNGHDGTLVGAPTWSTGGRVGTFALTFNGTTHSMTVPGTGLTLDPTKSYTWSFWVRPNGFSEWQALWSQTQTDGARPYFAIYVHSTNDTDWGPVTQGVSAGWFTSSGSASAHSASNVLSPNTWSYVTVTYDASKPPVAAFTIYVNGLPSSGGSSANGSLTAIPTTKATLGSDTWGDPLLAGSVDSGFIEDRLYSAAEVNTLYRSMAGAAGRPAHRVSQ